MRFSPRAGDATIFKKSHHHRKQKIARVAAASLCSRFCDPLSHTKIMMIYARFLGYCELKKRCPFRAEPSRRAHYREYLRILKLRVLFLEKVHKRVKHV